MPKRGSWALSRVLPENADSYPPTEGVRTKHHIASCSPSSVVTLALSGTAEYGVSAEVWRERFALALSKMARHRMAVSADVVMAYGVGRFCYCSSHT